MTGLSIAIYAVWLAVEVWINRGLRLSGSDAPGKDRHSTRTIWVAVGVCMPAAILVSLFMPGHWQAPVAGWGLCILAAGLLLRVYAVLSLGRYFTGTLTIRESHALKTDGLYAYLRHPSYTGLLLCFFGFGLSLAHPLSFLLVVVPLTALLLRRIRLEEDMLEAAFGDAYRQYRARSWRLIPFIY